MSNIIAFLLGLVSTVISWVNQPSAPTEPVAPAPTPAVPKPKISNQATLTQLILSETMNLGPMPGTGGTLTQDSPEVASQVASLIIKACDKYTFGLANVGDRIGLMAAWIRAESDFSPVAKDPNASSLPKNPTPQQILENSDLGIAQFSWRTLVAMPDFSEMTSDEIVTQALDPEWAVDQMGAFCDGLITSAKASCLADASLLKKVPNGDPLMLGLQSYNVGASGAVSMARSKGLSGNWQYALSVYKRYIAWRPLFV